MTDIDKIMGRTGDLIAVQRQKSLAKAIEEAPLATAEAARDEIDLKVTNDGHHWRFTYKGNTLLSFWPASAKAQKTFGHPFRCRGWRHALSIARQIAEKLKRELRYAANKK